MYDIKNSHLTNLKGIFPKRTLKKLCCSWGFGLSCLSFIFPIIYLPINQNIDYYNLLSKVSSLSISVFPSLLGFCVGGYALIIGFGHKEMLQKMSNPLGNNKDEMSFFQVVSSTFASSIIIQSFTLLFAFIVSTLINYNIDFLPICWSNFFNIISISLISFSSIYSIVLIYYMVKNIFIFGQTMHFCIRLENTVEKQKNNEQTNDI